ncbi:hypothetical protein CAOEGIBSW744_0841 [Cardinium endosymbiont of Oedothorax gibbosus]|nr:hypothetical protein CAOEGIBSW744_0841 [Cardinium endosymbiont of Oedothorax gibbosus]
MILLLVPLSTAEGCVKRLKPLRPLDPKPIEQTKQKKNSTVSIFQNRVPDSKQEQQSRHKTKSSLENVLLTDKKSKETIITAEAAATPVDTATQKKQTGPIYKDERDTHENSKGEHGSNKDHNGSDQRLHETSKEQQPKRFSVKKLINRLTKVTTRIGKKAAKPKNDQPAGFCRVYSKK